MNIKDFSIPKTAGCYLFKDSKDQIIYVGKSKYLPKRVTSYFQKNHEDSKTIKLVTEIKGVDFISTESENEALVLEEDLIKLYKPKFNIKGKDDRTVRSLLVISSGDWKKLDLFFPKDEFTGDVLAEFTSAKMAHGVMSILGELFSFRSCSYDLTEKNIESKKFKACLDWHIGKCDAPCVGLASKLEHLLETKLVRDIFRQDFSSTKKHFTRKMKWHSDNLEFEIAEIWKQKLVKLGQLQQILKPLKVFKLRKKTEEIQKALGLKFLPSVIDAFDNSHTGGSDAVCGLVRFNLLQPQKDQWRKFIIKSGCGGDDYASFEEVLRRRFLRLINEGVNLPNLIIIDGARPQLNVAISVLQEFELVGKLDVISISKCDKHKAKTIHLESGSDVDIKDFNELVHISNEVHRFSLDFHRKRRSKSFFK